MAQLETLAGAVAMQTPGPEFSRFEKYFLWFGAWFVALFYLLLECGLASGLTGWVFFPCGLAPHRHWMLDRLSVLWWAIGWLFYGSMSFVALKSRRTGIYFALLGTLIVLLVVDFRGCRTLLEQWAHESWIT